jgi:hypothetical protein
VILNKEEEAYLKEEHAGTKKTRRKGHQIKGSSSNLIFQISAKGE